MEAVKSRKVVEARNDDCVHEWLVSNSKIHKLLGTPALSDVDEALSVSLQQSVQVKSVGIVGVKGTCALNRQYLMNILAHGTILGNPVDLGNVEHGHEVEDGAGKVLKDVRDRFLYLLLVHIGSLVDRRANGVDALGTRVVGAQQEVDDLPVSRQVGRRIGRQRLIEIRDLVHEIAGHGCRLCGIQVIVRIIRREGQLDEVLAGGLADEVRGVVPEEVADGDRTIIAAGA